MQRGSVIQTNRKQGPDVWQFRWSEKNLNGHRVFRKRVIGTVEQYADAAAVRHAASALLSDVNLRSRQDRIGSITIDQLCELLSRVRFVLALVCGVSQPRRPIAATFVAGSGHAGDLAL
jgi:integrase